jgi:hypothetical protein
VKERALSIFRLHWPIKGICSLSFFSEECHACCVWRLKSISSVTKEDYSLATKLQNRRSCGLILFVLQVFRVPKFLTREHLINAAWWGSAMVAKVLSPCW